MSRTRPVVVHLTTTDMSLDWLLRPQLEAFARAGYEVLGMSAPGQHVDALRAAGIDHVAIPALSRSAAGIGDLRAAAQIWRALRRLRPDILHTHNPKPGVIGRIVGRLAGVPLVVNTQHGLYAQPTDRRRRRWPVYAAERLAAAFGHVELVQNPEDVSTLVNRLRVPRRKVRALGNGIDLDRFDPRSVSAHDIAAVRHEWGVGEGELVVGAVGRLVAEKGVAEICAAANRLRADGVPARVVIIGPADATKGDAVSDEVLASAAADGVVLAGQRNDMPQCYAAMDLFVTASWREGFPRATMEAAAMGVAVVATDVRGNRQAVDDGVSGVLTPVRDAAALAAAIARLLADRATRDRMGRAGQAKAAAQFDQRQVIEITLQAYRSRTRSSSPPPAG